MCLLLESGPRLHFAHTLPVIGQYITVHPKSAFSCYHPEHFEVFRPWLRSESPHRRLADFRYAQFSDVDAVLPYQDYHALPPVLPRLTAGIALLRNRRRRERAS